MRARRRVVDTFSFRIFRPMRREMISKFSSSVFPLSLFPISVDDTEMRNV